MSPAPRTTDHVDHSHGGRAGHVARRLVHVGMAAIPWAWYAHGAALERTTGVPRDALLGGALLAIVALEALRIARGLTVFGMRAYEARQVSAVAWGGASLCLVLLFAPPIGVAGAAIGAPIIVTLALADPLMGELRRARRPARAVAGAGLLVAAAVWAAAAYWLGGPGWLVAVMAPLAVAAEWPKLRWVDDNATMTLIPLVACLLLDLAPGLAAPVG